MQARCPVLLVCVCVWGGGVIVKITEVDGLTGGCVSLSRGGRGLLRGYRAVVIIVIIDFDVVSL